jgi:hypothetical protein
MRLSMPNDVFPLCNSPPVGGGLGDRGGGLAQHGDDLAGPVLLGGVQFEDALGVADQMGCTLADAGPAKVNRLPQ